MPPENQDSSSIARSAAIVSIGNVLSRIMGLARGIVVSDLFGAQAAILAYNAADIVPRRFFELLIGGMITSALVPTLSEYAADPDRREFSKIASLLFTLSVLTLGLVILVSELGAPLITRFLVSGFDAPLQSETTHLLRITLLGMLFLGLSGLATALCQALRRFALPAFTTVVFNIGVVVAALLWGRQWGVSSLAAGLVLGALAQFVLQLPALRDVCFRPVLDLRHPALRRILRLYLPIVAGMIPNELGIVLDRNLASGVGNSLAIMDYATQLRQFPLGLVSMAISTAILPTLARQTIQEQTHGRSDIFRETLTSGLRLVLVLTLPAAVALFILAEPIVALIFEHGNFTAQDTLQTALALRHYLFGMVFAAIDQPLVFAFYARGNTLVPALVGVAGVGLYALTAIPAVRPWGMVGLILANNVQLAGHMLLMLVLFWKKVGPLHTFGIGTTTIKAFVASAAMGAAIYGVRQASALFAIGGRLGWALTVGACAVVGFAVYLAAAALLRMQELGTLVRALRGRRRG